MSDFNRRTFLKLMAAGIVPFAFPRSVMPETLLQSETEKSFPNIVLILADDMGYGDPGCYNPESKTPTPNIDRLATQGIRLTKAHSPGATCIPSRYGLLTGRYPLRVNTHLIRKQALIEPGRMTIASLLQRIGYRTAGIGKWHLGFDNWQDANFCRQIKGGPADHGFDYFFGMHASLDIAPYFYIENTHCVEPPSETIQEHHSPGMSPIQGEFWRGGKIAPGFTHKEVLPMFTKKAVEFLESCATHQKKKPFFLYLALAAPHTPWLPLDKFRGASSAGEYGDFVNQVDHTVGTVMDKLKERNLAQNTLLIFTSDNGPVWFQENVQHFHHRSAYFLRGMKGDFWEGGHRMPFIARWPGKITPNSVSDETICFTDMLATFAALTRQKLPENAGEDSYNILPILTGQKHHRPLREATVIENRAILSGEWKLIFGSGRGGISKRYAKGIEEEPLNEVVKGELYNLANDPSETKNLYAERPDIVARLTGLMQKYKNESRSVSR